MGHGATAHVEVQGAGSTTARRAARAHDDVRPFRDSVGDRAAVKTPDRNPDQGRVPSGAGKIGSGLRPVGRGYRTEDAGESLGEEPVSLDTPRSQVEPSLVLRNFFDQVEVDEEFKVPLEDGVVYSGSLLQLGPSEPPTVEGF